MIEKLEIESWVNEFLEGKESYLVEVRIGKENSIEVEIDNFKGVDVEECASLSRFIEEHLNRDREDFSLEVGSSGLTAPLRVRKQYEKNIGNEIELFTSLGKKLVGRLSKVEEETFSIVVKEMVKKEGKKRKEEEEKEFSFRYDEVKSARYNLKV